MNNKIVQAGSLLTYLLFILGGLFILGALLIIIYPQLLAYLVASLLFIVGVSIWGYAWKVHYWQNRVQKMFKVDVQI